MVSWDEKKNKINFIKHGIHFEDVEAVFSDEYSIEIYDGYHSEINEDRYICIGDVGDLVILFVVYTDENDNIRIISARKATKKETEAYYEYFKKATGRN